MSNTKQNALNLCRNILNAGHSPMNFEGNCIELKQGLDTMASLGRYGEIRVVMNEFELLCKKTRLKGPQMAFLASLIPLSLDSAAYLLHKESEESASATVGNLIQHQTFTIDDGNEIDLLGFLQDLLSCGYSAQACELLDAVQEFYRDDADAFMAEVIKVVCLAFDEGCAEVIAWLQAHEGEITNAFGVASQQHGCMSLGLELYDAGFKQFGTAMVKKRVAPDSDDLIRAEELLQISPNPPSSCNNQVAYIVYMLHRDDLSQDWDTIPLSPAQLVGDARDSLSNLLGRFNRDGRSATQTSLDRISGALIRRAKDYSSLDAMVLEINKFGGDLHSQPVISAVNDILHGIIDSKPAPGGVPAILYLDKLLNRSGKVDYSLHAQAIEDQINAWTPIMSLTELAGYADRIDKFAFNKRAMAAAIDAKWPEVANATVKEVLKDVVPRSIALHSKFLKVAVLEIDLGM